MPLQIERRLKATLLRSLVAIRLDDAVALLKTNQAQRRNGAIYLAGYAAECALKAKICLERGEEHLDPQYFIHGIRCLAEKTKLWETLKQNVEVLNKVTYLETEWSVVLRYQHRPLKASDVELFIRRVREFCKWLFEN